jgi:AraC-like DNA-binding protein
MEYIGICANERKDASPLAANYSSHSHDSYEIFLPVAGSFEFEVSNYLYTVGRGSVLILPPAVTHRLVVKDSEPLEYLYVQFTPRVIPDETEMLAAVEALFNSHGEGELSMRRLSGESFSYVYAAVKRLCTSGTRDVHEQFFRILYPVLCEILTYGTPVNGKYDGFTKESSRQSTLTDQIIEYISQNYADIQDLSFVIEVFHYSTVHVNSLFKNRLGVSLWRYILHIRLDRACDMLVNGIHASEVALSCGFKDYSTFYRMFKKCYGITPTECRRMGRKPEMIL